MNVAYLLCLILRFMNPVPVEPEWEFPIPVVEAPAYIRMETGEYIYTEEGQDGGDVNMAELDLYQ